AIWPEPEPSAQAEEVPPSWQKLARAIAEIPPGAWTTYGDLAALIGNHPVPVGARIAKHPMTNGHRVLQAEGTISPGFRWYEPDRTEDPQSVLEEEGVRFDAAGRAPFDDLQLRDARRSRLNRISGVDSPPSKLTLRPRVRCSPTSSRSGLETFVSPRGWLIHEVDEHSSAPADEGAPTLDRADVGSEE